MCSAPSPFRLKPTSRAVVVAWAVAAATAAASAVAAAAAAAASVAVASAAAAWAAASGAASPAREPGGSKNSGPHPLAPSRPCHLRKKRQDGPRTLPENYRKRGRGGEGLN